jgi:asparagine synthase (glutamine-hydrolysing)
MPGLTLVVRRGGAEDALADPVRGRRLSDGETRVLHADPRVWLATSGPPDYPVRVREEGPLLVALEGRLYAGAAPDDVVRAMLATPPDETRITRWLASVDGDFVLVAVDRRDGRAAALNDRYGRLPLYVVRDAERVVVSREIWFAAAARSHARLDRAAIAQFLLFGYPLGTATLHEGVARVPPATLVHGPDAAAHTLLGARYDEKRDDPDAARRLADALVTACRARAAGGAANVVTMSGGIDSRMAAAALRRAGVAAVAVTHSDVHGVAARDVTLARQVSERLGMPWTLVQLGPATGAEMARLLRLKGGANYLGMSHVVPFFARLRADHGGRAVVFTGDGGDKILVDQRPLVRLRDDAALADYVLRRESILDADAVARLTGTARDALARGVRDRVASYPEATPAERYVHFMFAERAFKFLFEGEDRNRCFVWTVTPFYAPDVFETAMAVPDARKAGHRLRSEVLALVGPEVAGLVNASTGWVLSDPRLRRRARLEERVKALLYRALPPAIDLPLRRWLRPPHGYGPDSGALRAVRTLLADCPAVADYVDVKEAERLLADAGRYRREQFSVLLTVAALADEATQGGRVLASLRDVVFD